MQGVSHGGAGGEMEGTGSPAATAQEFFAFVPLVCDGGDDVVIVSYAQHPPVSPPLTPLPGLLSSRPFNPTPCMPQYEGKTKNTECGEYDHFVDPTRHTVWDEAKPAGMVDRP